jgi:O-antigen/teichoic acid export membrane protein
VTTSLNNIFTVTNKLKVNSLFLLVISFTNVFLVFVLLNTTSLGIYAVAGVSKVTGILGNLFFIPIYACKCLKIKWNRFYSVRRIL